MTGSLSIISSMATRQILGELAGAYSRHHGQAVRLVSIGGVDAARRIRGGETFDVVILASDALEGLTKEGFVAGDTIGEFARSPTALALRVGAPRPAVCDEAAIRAIVSSARRIGLSTGPSGTSMAKLLEAWGIPASSDRVMRAPPAVPVARLIASGEVDVGFQQLSELLGEPDIEITGTVPAELQPMTIFAAGVMQAAADTIGGPALLAYPLSPQSASIKRKYGMEPGLPAS